MGWSVGVEVGVTGGGRGQGRGAKGLRPEGWLGPEGWARVRGELLGGPAKKFTPMARMKERKAFGSTLVLAGSGFASASPVHALLASGLEGLSSSSPRFTLSIARRAGSSSIIVITFLIGIIALSTSLERAFFRIASATESIAGYEARSMRLALMRLGTPAAARSLSWMT